MIQFQCDYNEGCHPLILEALRKTNMEQTVGYGEDDYCEMARQAIRKAVGSDDVDVHFLVGGTQANTTVISSVLRPHQGVLAADTGHVSVHETGAIEHTGHKVLVLPSCNGKIDATQIKAAIDSHYAEDGPEHMVQPGMVYISFPTEVGSVYSKKELQDISSVCRHYGLPLFVDGARLGYGLCSQGCDVTMETLAQCCDVFYIGGTKVGALFGEAVVIVNNSLKRDFRYFIKQQGGMLAKGRLLGLQFLTLFTDNLYYSISRHAIDMAMLLKNGLQQLGVRFYAESPTNQQFVVLDNATLQRMEQDFVLSPWMRIDDKHTVVRICTSWATKEENVNKLLQAIKKN